ncbi:MAG: pilus (MSHA type) biogenesis protein MshL, partial [Shewanella sp.]
MTAIKYFTPLLSLCLMACQTTDRPQPTASKEALSASSMQAASQPTPPPPATMPDAVQRELNANTLMGGLTAPMETERRIDV